VNAVPVFAGTAGHQKLLRAITDYYADDPRILAVAVFGSLARGTWDCFSDLDLDIVIADDVQMNVREELRQLCDRLAFLGEPAALIVPDDEDAGDVVLDSLMEFSIRYHPLATTSPNIVDDLQVLAGKIDRAAIQRAGLKNRRASETSPGARLDVCVRYAVGVDVAIHRRRIWMAIELLHRMRGIVLELLAAAYGGARPLKFIDQADASLQACLGATLAQQGCSVLTLRHSLGCCSSSCSC